MVGADFTMRATHGRSSLARLPASVRDGRPSVGRDVRLPFASILAASLPVRASTTINVAALILGAALLAWTLDGVGAETWATVAEVGEWFAVIAAIDLLSVCCDAYAIHGYLRPHVEVSYPRVFAAEFSGLAINRVSPMNSLGEPIKMTMLMRDVPAEHAVSAVVMFNLTTTYVALATIAIGVPISIALLDLPSQIVTYVWLTLGVLLVSAVALALLVRTGPLTALIDAAAAMHLVNADRATRWRAKVAGIDERLRMLGRLRAPGMARGIAGVVGSRVLNGIGTVLVLHAAGIPLSPPLVIAMLSIGILITWISNIVPLGLGLAQGGNYLVFSLFGGPASSGVLFAFVNQLRTILLAAMGLMVMLIANLFHRRYHRAQ
jgi:hypothetical protein